MIIESIYFVPKGLPFECLVAKMVIFRRSVELSHRFSRIFSLLVSGVCWSVDKPKKSRFGQILASDKGKIQDTDRRTEHKMAHVKLSLVCSWLLLLWPNWEQENSVQSRAHLKLHSCSGNTELKLLWNSSLWNTWHEELATINQGNW